MLKSSLVLAAIICGWRLLWVVHAGAEGKPDNYFPLAVGNRWVYESSEGTEAEPVLEAWEVIRHEGNSFVVQIQQPFVTIGSLEEQFVVTSEGVQRRLPDATTGEPQLQPILKLPSTVSASWQGADGHYTVTTVDEAVTVPAGTFTHCVEVTRFRKETKVTEIITYAPGVGIIQRDETFPVIGGFGDFETQARGHTVLRLKEWKTVNSQLPATQSK
ncbi:MAG: hypothetical protein HY267_01375 [Deltaproteobacteria bacterium]|nr:hypothetical protein [Deltaproteobacteria bacterium]